MEKRTKENVKKDKFSPNLFLSKDARKIINAQSLILLYPINVVKKICYNSKINFADFMKNYAYDLEDRNENDVKLIDILIKSKDKRFLFKTPKFVFFPRNVFWMHKLYDLVWKSKNLKKNLPNGKTIKISLNITNSGTKKTLWLNGTEETDKITLNAEQPIVEVTRKEEKITLTAVVMGDLDGNGKSLRDDIKDIVYGLVSGENGEKE